MIEPAIRYGQMSIDVYLGEIETEREEYLIYGCSHAFCFARLAPVELDSGVGAVPLISSLVMASSVSDSVVDMAESCSDVWKNCSMIKTEREEN